MKKALNNSSVCPLFHAAAIQECLQPSVARGMFLFIVWEHHFCFHSHRPDLSTIPTEADSERDINLEISNVCRKVCQRSDEVSTSMHLNDGFVAYRSVFNSAFSRRSSEKEFHACLGAFWESVSAKHKIRVLEEY